MFHILSGGNLASVKAEPALGDHYIPERKVESVDGIYKAASKVVSSVVGGSSTASSGSRVQDGSGSSSSSYRAGGGSSISSNGNGHDHDNHHSNNGQHKKRNRRRRKGKSRSKVEPLSSAASPVKGALKGTGLCSSSNSKKQHDAPMTKRDLYFALDCEMVGVGPDGLTSAVGRVTIVNWENQIVLDTYVMVPTPVTDYRTYISGITPEHLQPRPGHPLMTFSEVRAKVQDILRGKILIGHGLENDLKALGLYHPWTDIRDTATIPFFMREFRDPVSQCVTLAPKKLRDLAWEKLGRQIQIPGVPHSPMEDAIAALDLYKEVRGQWEDHLIKVAQEKEKDQQQQLLERQKQQQRQQQEEQRRQQQQQQLRRWQWLATGPPPPPPPPQLYPTHAQQQQQQQQQQVMMQQAMMQSLSPQPTYPYRSTMPVPAVMVMPSPASAAASAYLQSPPTVSPQPRQQQEQQQQPMRSSSSSWFGFSRRSRQSSSARQYIPRTVSQESITTQGTMTTIQSSFSQEYVPGIPSSRGGGAWHVQEEEDEEIESYGYHDELYTMDELTVASFNNHNQQHFATEASQETTWGASLEMIMDSRESAAVIANSYDPSEAAESCTESTESAMSTTTATTDDYPQPKQLLPKDYEPPRYFTNPDPEPMSSSSWFKLWGSSKNKGQDASSTKGNNEELDTELLEENSEKNRRSSESEATQSQSSSSYSLFSGRLFPRRASESCMTAMAEREVDEHSRSMH